MTLFFHLKRKKISSLLKKVSDFIFPSFCIHCEEKTLPNRILCSVCSENLVVAHNHPIGALFEENPVSEAFIDYCKKFPTRSVYKTYAAFVVLKYCMQNLSIPHMIYYTHKGFVKKVSKEVARYFQVPNKKLRKKIPYTSLLILTEKSRSTLENLHASHKGIYLR